MSFLRLKVSPLPKSCLTLLGLLGFFLPAGAQLIYTVDSFAPSGVGGSSYIGGHIGDVWGNWFGSAFQSLVWDATSDASNNPASGSMKITADFNGQGSIPNQFEVYNGFNGIAPPLNGLQYTNFQCDVRFAPGSATLNNTFGHLQFGIAVGYGQDYFGGIDVPATETNWVHVSLTLNAATDTNLQDISCLLIHIYGPTMSGVSTLWVDNIKFEGAVPVTTNCVVDWNDLHQRIDGFGASSAWHGSMSPAQEEIFFSTNNGIVYTDNLGNTSTNNGIGLSLLRNRIAPANSTSASATPGTLETSVMQAAVSYNVNVWSTPWTPAAGFKDNLNLSGGGFVGTTANYQAYASQLANYVVSMKNQGIDLYAISVQNEPDANVNTYDSCNWTGQEIHDFVPYLYAALTSAGVGSTRIMLPESQNWLDYSNLAATVMSDPAVAADVGIIADHNYDGGNGPGVLAKNDYGKALWETEVSLLRGSDGSIANGVYYAQRIYRFMTEAQVNAWHYWWLISGNTDGNQGLMDSNAGVTKRLFTVGNYSRFVRPGFYRIGVSNNALTSISAYKDPNSDQFAIVAVNTANTIVTQVFDLSNFTADAVTPWITSSNLSLASQPAVTVSDASFSYALPALSVVTFTGRAGTAVSNSPPTLQSIADQRIDPGVSLAVTNVAVDADVPPQTLTFSLLNAPVTATLTTLDATNAVFKWRPPLSQANTTNLITIRVTDNGTPALSATNTFHVFVNPLAPTILDSITAPAGHLSFRVNGPQGPDYTILTSSNLMDWQSIYTTNAPFIFVDTNLMVDPERFYRVQLGP